MIYVDSFSHFCELIDTICRGGGHFPPPPSFLGEGLSLQAKEHLLCASPMCFPSGRISISAFITHKVKKFYHKEMVIQNALSHISETISVQVEKAKT